MFSLVTKANGQPSAATIFVDDIHKEMDNRKLTDVVFLDLTKAFDTISHAVLLKKICSYGVYGNKLDWFKDYLFQRTQSVHIKNSFSTLRPIFSGVPQGSILGPLLFILLMNDIPGAISHCNIALYADDTVLFISRKSNDDILKALNADLSSLDNWFKENNLVINLKKGKTEYVLYGTSQKLKKKSNTNCNINGYNINETHSYKYLGVTLDNKINLIDHFHKTYKKASGRIRLLKRIRHNISPSTAGSIYQMMIQPIIFYCNNILVNIPDSHAKKFQYIQDRAKLIINNNEITSK